MQNHIFDFQYLIFLEKLNSGSLVQMLFGFDGGWGGYSNLFIELIIRLGLLGLSLYLLAIFFALKLTLNMTAKLTNPAQNQFFRLSRSPLWLFFFLSTVAANIININLQLPYYVLNLIFIILMFLYIQYIFEKPSKPVGCVPASV